MLRPRACREGTRFLHTKVQTFYSPTLQFVQQHLAQNSLPKESVSVFLLSTSLPDLPQLLPVIKNVSSRSIGSLFVAPPGSEPSLSLATFWDADIHLFKSSLTGRAPAEVGRFQRPEKQRNIRPEDLRGSTQNDMERTFQQGWEGIWKGKSESANIKELDGIEAEAFFLLSDSRPTPVLDVLDRMFPQAIKTGLLTAPTPFITNRPHTLFYNDEVLESGTIGLAINQCLEPVTEFGLTAMTKPVNITSARGNMLLEIDGVNPNPTQLLIRAIQERGGSGITKEEEFYLGFLESGKVQRVVRILSGDPSRGAMSLDTEESLVKGQTIQYMHRSAPLHFAEPIPHSVTFTSLPLSEEVDEHPLGQPRVVDGFVASSEGGFIYSNPSTSICTAPGAVTTTCWSSST